MTSAEKRKQPDLSQILVEGFPEVGNFEDIPKVRKIAGPATGPYVLVLIARLISNDSPGDSMAKWQS